MRDQSSERPRNECPHGDVIDGVPREKECACPIAIVLQRQALDLLMRVGRQSVTEVEAQHPHLTPRHVHARIREIAPALAMMGDACPQDWREVAGLVSGGAPGRPIAVPSMPRSAEPNGVTCHVNFTGGMFGGGEHAAKALRDALKRLGVDTRTREFPVDPAAKGADFVRLPADGVWVQSAHPVEIIRRVLTGETGPGIARTHKPDPVLTILADDMSGDDIAADWSRS
jgi:hypothetical protein